MLLCQPCVLSVWFTKGTGCLLGSRDDAVGILLLTRLFWSARL